MYSCMSLWWSRWLGVTLVTTATVSYTHLARACAKPGDIIILSPASASFDLYPNFEVRGREFKKIVNELK